MNRRGSGAGWMIFGFPAFAVVLATIAVYFRVRGGASPALWILPPAVGALTFYFMRRVFTLKSLPSTTHQYQLLAPSSGDGVTVERLLAALTDRGYDVDVRAIDEAGNVGAPVTAGQELVGTQLRLIERRADAEAGMVTVRLRRGDDGRLLGLIEATDTGPGIYDEMAQFAIVALSADIPSLEYVAFGRSAERRTPENLRGELPEQPLGLALL